MMLGKHPLMHLAIDVLLATTALPLSAEPYFARPAFAPDSFW